MRNEWRSNRFSTDFLSFSTSNLPGTYSGGIFAVLRGVQRGEGGHPCVVRADCGDKRRGSGHRQLPGSAQRWGERLEAPGHTPRDQVQMPGHGRGISNPG